MEIFPNLAMQRGIILFYFIVIFAGSATYSGELTKRGLGKVCETCKKHFG